VIKATTPGLVSASVTLNLSIKDYSACNEYMIIPSYYAKTYHITNTKNRIYFGMWDSTTSTCPVTIYGASS
jgi:hypothetical protein